MLYPHLLTERFHIYCTSTTPTMKSYTILFTAEYLNAYFFYGFLLVYALPVLKALFYANFRKLC